MPDLPEFRPSVHQLSIIAAKIVTHSEFRPGVWDFEAAFAPYLALMDLQARAAENRLAASATAVNEGRLLFLMKRATELQESISAVEAHIASLDQ